MKNIGLIVTPEAVEELFELNSGFDEIAWSKDLMSILYNINTFLLNNGIEFSFQHDPYFAEVFDFVGIVYTFEPDHEGEMDIAFNFEHDIPEIVRLINANSNILKVEAIEFLEADFYGSSNTFH